MNTLTGLPLTEQLCDYVRGQLPPADDVDLALIEQTAALGAVVEMQVPPEQVALLSILTASLGARLVVEVGTFTGFSTLGLARGLAAGGKVITIDISEEWTAIAAEHWTRAGVRDRIDLRIGPAREQLALLPRDADIDVAFIDADKVGYLDYWNLIVPRMRPGGLILVDNVLYGGEAADPDATGNARAIRIFNDAVRLDDRVEAVLLPLFDGLTVARRANVG